MAQERVLTSRWSLDDLFPNREAWEQAFGEAEARVAEIEAWRERLDTLTPQDFQSLLEKMEVLVRLMERIGSYAFLRFAENSESDEAQAMVGRVRQWRADIQNRLLFFELWWKNLPDEQAAALLEVAGDRRYYLEKMRLFRPYTLDEQAERIINYKTASGVRPLVTVYSTMTSRYLFPLEVDGEVKQLTRGELSTYVRHPDPNLRERAYKSLFDVFVKDKSLIAPIYQAVVTDWYNEHVRIRGYKRPISPRNLYNHLPDEVVDTLLEVCREQAEVFRRYFRVKAKALGVPKLRRYDIYAPVGKAEKTYPYATAVEMVLQAYERFHPEMARLARQVFETQHVDSETRKAKYTGAFCSSVEPSLVPWVLLNYQGQISDVATLAHELGHAVHSLLAREHSVFTFHAPLPLAETASTFGEMLLVDMLLEQETDPEVRKAVLFHQLDENYATIMRQAYFALFEMRAHDLFPQGASAEDVAQAYWELLEEQFGDAVDLSDEFRWEWLMIPHFYHTPFYVYAYAFGQLLVLALYKRYREEGASFKPRYLNLLAAGGSRPPMDLLADVDVNPADPNFWRGGFAILDDLVTQLEDLVG